MLLLFACFHTDRTQHDRFQCLCLPLIAETNLDVIVRLSQFNSKELRLLHMKALIQAFTNDPDLATIHQSEIPLTMQVVYVCTGCDFISFFHSLGKAYFLNTLFEPSFTLTMNKLQEL